MSEAVSQKSAGKLNVSSKGLIKESCGRPKGRRQLSKFSPAKQSGRKHKDNYKRSPIVEAMFHDKYEDIGENENKSRNSSMSILLAQVNKLSFRPGTEQEVDRMLVQYRTSKEELLSSFECTLTHLVRSLWISPHLRSAEVRKDLAPLWAMFRQGWNVYGWQTMEDVVRSSKSVNQSVWTLRLFRNIECFWFEEPIFSCIRGLIKLNQECERPRYAKPREVEDIIFQSEDSQPLWYSQVASKVIKVLTNLFTGVTLNNIWEKIKEFFSLLSEKLMCIFHSIRDTMLSCHYMTVGSIVDSIKSIKKSFQVMATTLALYLGIGPVVAVVKEMVGSHWSTFKSIFSSCLSMILNLPMNSVIWKSLVSYIFPVEHDGYDNDVDEVSMQGSEFPLPAFFAAAMTFVGLSVNDAKFKTFSDFINKSKYTTDLVDYLVTNGKRVSKGLMFVITGDASYLAKSNLDKVLKVMEEAEEVINLENLAELSTCNDDYSIRLKSVFLNMKDLYNIVLASKEFDATLRTTFLRVYGVITKMSQALYKRSDLYAGRIMPAWLYLHGKPGQGKTSSIKGILSRTHFKLRQTLPQLYKEKFNLGMIYTHQQSDKFWEGYVNQWVANIDELFVSKIVQTKSETATMLTQIVNEGSCVLPMAFEGKGVTCFTSEVVVTTTNIEGLENVGVTCPGALVRRMKFPIEVVRVQNLDPERPDYDRAWKFYVSPDVGTIPTQPFEGLVKRTHKDSYGNYVVFSELSDALYEYLYTMNTNKSLSANLMNEDWENWIATGADPKGKEREVETQSFGDVYNYCANRLSLLTGRVSKAYYGSEELDKINLFLEKFSQKYFFQGFIQPLKEEDLHHYRKVAESTGFDIDELSKTSVKGFMAHYKGCIVSDVQRAQFVKESLMFLILSMRSEASVYQLGFLGLIWNALRDIGYVESAYPRSWLELHTTLIRVAKSSNMTLLQHDWTEQTLQKYFLKLEIYPNIYSNERAIKFFDELGCNLFKVVAVKEWLDLPFFTDYREYDVFINECQQLDQRALIVEEIMSLKDFYIMWGSCRITSEEAFLTFPKPHPFDEVLAKTLKAVERNPALFIAVQVLGVTTMALAFKIVAIIIKSCWKTVRSMLGRPDVKFQSLYRDKEPQVNKYVVTKEEGQISHIRTQAGKVDVNGYAHYYPAIYANTKFVKLNFEGGKTACGFGFFVRTNQFAIAAHYIRWEKPLTHIEIVTEDCNNSVVISARDFVVRDKSVDSERNPRDLCIIFIRPGLLDSKVDMWKRLLEEPAQRVTNVVRLEKTPLVNGRAVKFYQQKTDGAMFSEAPKTATFRSGEGKLRMVYKGYYVVVNGFGEPGNCGFPYAKLDGDRNILGIHTGRLGNDSYVAPLFRSDFLTGEQLSKLFDVDIVQPDYEDVSLEFQCTETMPTLPGLFCIGQVSSSSKVFMPRDTVFRPSPFQGDPELELMVAPARLSNFTNEQGDFVSPFSNSLKFKNSLNVDIDSEFLYSVVGNSELFHGVDCELPTSKKLEYFSYEDAIYGNDSTDALDFTTSVGFNPPGGIKTRRGLFGDKESRVMHPELLKALECINSKSEEGIIPVHTVSMCLKDELRDMDRVRIGNTRLFCVGQVTHCVWTKCTLGPLFEDRKKHYSMETSAVGTNPHGFGWEILYGRINKFPNRFAGDFSGFDYSLILYFLMLFFMYCNNYYNFSRGSKEYNRLLSCCWSLFSAQYVWLNNVYKSAKSNSSGNWATSIINGFVCAVLHRLIFMKLRPDNRLKFCDHVSLIVYGDDNIGSCSDEVASWFNMLSIGKACRDMFGMFYTSATKGEVVKPFINDDELMFLGREFRVKHRNVYAPLRWTAINGMLNWSKDPVGSSEIFEQNLHNVMMEMLHYGEDYYDKMKELIVRLCRKYNFHLMKPLPTYSMWIDRYLEGCQNADYPSTQTINFSF